VLAYHHVGDTEQTAPWVTVSAEQFAEQIAFLASQRLVLPLDQLLAELRCGRVPRGGHVVVTFDDAALDTLTVALPILRRHAVPATVFVPTGLLGQSGSVFWWDRLSRLGRSAAKRNLCLGAFLVRAGVLNEELKWDDDKLWRRLRLLDDGRRRAALDRVADWLPEDSGANASRPMTWDELAELDRSDLITLGAHTISHPVLASLDEKGLTAEVTGSRDALAGFRSFRKVFAYPYGDAPAIGVQAERAVSRAGFEAAFTTEEVALAGHENRMALGRVCIDEMSLESFRWVIDRHLSA
jgi:peptidoglycan/xylan/chitin deacetylase (PgdA/CDA1 family)